MQQYDPPTYPIYKSSSTVVGAIGLPVTTGFMGDSTTPDISVTGGSGSLTASFSTDAGGNISLILLMEVLLC